MTILGEVFIINESVDANEPKLSFMIVTGNVKIHGRAAQLANFLQADDLKVLFSPS